MCEGVDRPISHWLGRMYMSVSAIAGHRAVLLGLNISASAGAPVRVVARPAG